MKLILVLLAISLAQCGFEKTTYPWLQSTADLKKRLGLHLSNLSNIPTRSYKNFLRLVTLPESFDARDQWPTCVHPIRDQQHCGSCWAFAGSETLTDRFCIASNGAKTAVLSPQYMVSCDTSNSGCNGGYLDREWVFLENTGTVTDECRPYVSGSGNVPACQSTCEDGSSPVFYKSEQNSLVKLTDIESIKMELMANGPVETGFTVYNDFMNYKSGIYTRGWFTYPVGGHAVKIVGWGVENGVHFWSIANSWGSSWGENGFFRIKQGICSVDSMAVAGTPQL